MKKIRGLKPTRQQNIILEKNGMHLDDWLIKKVYPDHLLCVHRYGFEMERKAFFEVTRA